MFTYQKRTQYPIDIKHKDVRMARYILTQYGGPYGELGAAIRYLNHRYTMPDERGKTLLTDIGTEELGHVEMICMMVYQLTKDATIQELEEGGLGGNFATHGIDMFPVDANGQDFSVTGIGATGDFIANLSEDMAAEEKARATYEHLIDLATDAEVIKPLLFLRQREVVHFNRFKELYEVYKREYKSK